VATEAETREALEKLKAAIIGCDVEGAKKATQELLAKGIDPMLAIEEGIRGSSGVVAEKFDSGEYFLPHLVMAGEAMTEASKILEGALPKDSIGVRRVVVIGTVEADLHAVGKNIVAMMLRTSGFEVHDLGVDVKASTFIARARETNADIIGLSSLMTTTRPYQREVIEELESVGLRDRFKVIVGGGPVTEEWAKEIGADGYGKDAVEAVEVARSLVGVKA
jgi:corrinoid protein of di/trimethylamine methyltransferase